MIDTARIRTGFDIELQLGARWFEVALQGLADEGGLLPDPPPPPFTSDSVLVITAVEIVFVPNRDLRVEFTVDEIPLALFATLVLSEDGTELIIATDLQGFEITIPLEVFDDLAGPPKIVKVQGGDGFAPAMALLANLDLLAGPQSGDPEGNDDRGEPLLAQSFLPIGKDIVMGLGRDTFSALANNIWHTELTDDDGNQPLPDKENQIGTWKVARMTPQNGRIRLTLVGEVPIDFWPDGKITIEVDLRPSIEDGAITFELKIDTDVDTGILGDIFAFLIGGLVGLIVGFIIGGPAGALYGAAFGATLGVVALEVVEVIVEGKVRQLITAELEDESLAPVLVCTEDAVIGEALPTSDDGGGLALLLKNANLRSIQIAEEQPDPLHVRHTLVSVDFDELAIDGSGFAAAGLVHTRQRSEPLPVALVDRVRETATGDGQGDLVALVYEAKDGTRVELPLDEVLQRIAVGSLVAPVYLSPLPGEADVTLVGDQLATVCLSATNVRRAKTVVTDIRFSTGLDLRVSETVMLQDAGALLLRGLQLIHPKNARPYYRAFADESTENNFENLQRF